MFLVVSLSKSVVDLWQRRTIVEQERKRLTEIEKKHDELQQKLETVQTPEFIEREARERLGMAKEGETIILMDETPFFQNGEGGGDMSISSTLPHWKRWWQAFF